VGSSSCFQSDRVATRTGAGTGRLCSTLVGGVSAILILFPHTRLITVSNSMITSVSNFSKDWARVDLSIPIPYDADMSKAMQLIQQTAEAMGADPA
jgi:small-conductance mechanosensitive channel